MAAAAAASQMRCLRTFKCRRRRNGRRSAATLVPLLLPLPPCAAVLACQGSRSSSEVGRKIHRLPFLEAHLVSVRFPASHPSSLEEKTPSLSAFASFAMQVSSPAARSPSHCVGRPTYLELMSVPPSLRPSVRSSARCRCCLRGRGERAANGTRGPLFS